MLVCVPEWYVELATMIGVCTALFEVSVRVQSAAIGHANAEATA